MAGCCSFKNAGWRIPMTIQKRYFTPTVVGKAMEQVGTNQDLLFACAMQPSSHLSGVALHARAPYSRGSGGPVDTLGMQPPWHGGQPWVASRESAQPVTVEDIRNIGPGDLQPWPLNNTALKSIRDSSEDPPGTPINTGVELINSVVHEVLTLHRGKGMAYELREPKQPWSWRAMLNTLSDALLQRIVGPGINGFGLCPSGTSWRTAWMAPWCASTPARQRSLPRRGGLAQRRRGIHHHADDDGNGLQARGEGLGCLLRALRRD
jgi:hypothetical protein